MKSNNSYANLFLIDACDENCMQNNKNEINTTNRTDAIFHI